MINRFNTIILGVILLLGSLSSFAQNGGGQVPSGGGATLPGNLTGVQTDGSGNASQQTSVNAVSVLNNNPTTKLSQSLLPTGNAALGINHVTYQALFTGDSYKAGQGSNPLGVGYSYLIGQDIPAMLPHLYKMVSGTFSSDIVKVTWLNWVPSLTYSSVLLTNGGNNDWTADTCSKVSSSNCITNYTEEQSANLMWAAIPPQQRLCSSSAATPTGTWTASVLVPFSTYNCSTTTTGTALGSVVSGSTLTYSIPNTNNGYIGVNQITANANTGTYTISIGGVLQTNPCTSTTTFSSGPCGGTAMPTTPSAQRNQFFNSAWAGQTTQIIITTTNAASTAIAAVDYTVTNWPSNTSSAWVDNSGAAFDQAPGPYSAAIASLVTSLSPTGANVFLVDIRASLLALASGGVSLTPTIDCPFASLSGNHPGNCGQQAMYRKFIATEQANNYIISAPQIGGTTGTNQGVINATIQANPQQANIAIGAVPITAHSLNMGQITTLLLKFFDQGQVGAGIHYNGLSTTMPDGATNQNYISFFGSFNTAGATYACVEPAPTTTNVILSNTAWVPTACFNFLTGALATKSTVTTTQLITSGPTPTIAIGPGAGISPLTPPTIAGNNMSGNLTITTGTATAAGIIATITFNGTVVTPKGCHLDNADPNSALNAAVIYVPIPTSIGWLIEAAFGMTISTTYTYTYWCA